MTPASPPLIASSVRSETYPYRLRPIRQKFELHRRTDFVRYFLQIEDGSLDGYCDLSDLWF